MAFSYALACIIALEIFKTIKWFKKEKNLNINRAILPILVIILGLGAIDKLTFQFIDAHINRNIYNMIVGSVITAIWIVAFWQTYERETGEYVKWNRKQKIIHVIKGLYVIGTFIYHFFVYKQR